MWYFLFVLCEKRGGKLKTGVEVRGGTRWKRVKVERENVKKRGRRKVW